MPSSQNERTSINNGSQYSKSKKEIETPIDSNLVKAAILVDSETLSIGSVGQTSLNQVPH